MSTYNATSPERPIRLGDVILQVNARIGKDVPSEIEREAPLYFWILPQQEASDVEKLEGGEAEDPDVTLELGEPELGEPEETEDDLEEFLRSNLRSSCGDDVPFFVEDGRSGQVEERHLRVFTRSMQDADLVDTATLLERVAKLIKVTKIAKHSAAEQATAAAATAATRDRDRTRSGRAAQPQARARTRSPHRRPKALTGGPRRPEATMPEPARPGHEPQAPQDEPKAAPTPGSQPGEAYGYRDETSGAARTEASERPSAPPKARPVKSVPPGGGSRTKKRETSAPVRTAATDWAVDHERAPHKVLGIRPNATLREAKAAYYLMAKLHHPDKKEDALATQRFQRILAAFNTYVPARLRTFEEAIRRTVCETPGCIRLGLLGQKYCCVSCQVSLGTTHNAHCVRRRWMPPDPCSGEEGSSNRPRTVYRRYHGQQRETGGDDRDASFVHQGSDEDITEEGASDDVTMTSGDDYSSSPETDLEGRTPKAAGPAHSRQPSASGPTPPKVAPTTTPKVRQGPRTAAELWSSTPLCAGTALPWVAASPKGANGPSERRR